MCKEMGIITSLSSSLKAVNIIVYKSPGTKLSPNKDSGNQICYHTHIIITLCTPSHAHTHTHTHTLIRSVTKMSTYTRNLLEDSSMADDDSAIVAARCKQRVARVTGHGANGGAMVSVGKCVCVCVCVC